MAACHSDASGEEWISSSEYFGESKSFAKANSLMEFSATSDRVRGVAVKLIRQQGGNLRTLSETYGGGGWDMDFATYKRLADWQGVLGVNFVNQHLSYFTLRGVRKFDYPPSFTYHEPWWDDYRLLGDYIGRLSLAGSSGEQLNEILVLQPNTTAWMYFSRKIKNPVIDTIQNHFKTFTWQLERSHCQYDMGSEHVIKTLGSVQGSKLRVGNRAYGVVVIPSGMENLDNTTYHLMEEFLAGGGKIISFTSDIPYLDGEPSEAINEMLKRNPDQCLFVNEISDPLFKDAITPEGFAINEPTTGEGELYHQRRILDDGQLLMLVNSSADQPATATIEAWGKSVISLDPVSGLILQVPSVSEGKSVLDLQEANQLNPKIRPPPVNAVDFKNERLPIDVFIIDILLNF